MVPILKKYDFGNIYEICFFSTFFPQIGLLDYNTNIYNFLMNFVDDLVKGCDKFLK